MAFFNYSSHKMRHQVTSAFAKEAGHKSLADIVLKTNMPREKVTRLLKEINKAFGLNLGFYYERKIFFTQANYKKTLDLFKKVRTFNSRIAKTSKRPIKIINNLVRYGVISWKNEEKAIEVLNKYLVLEDLQRIFKTERDNLNNFFTFYPEYGEKINGVSLFAKVDLTKIKNDFLEMARNKLRGHGRSLAKSISKEVLAKRNFSGNKSALAKLLRWNEEEISLLAKNSSIKKLLFSREPDFAVLDELAKYTPLSSVLKSFNLSKVEFETFYSKLSAFDKQKNKLISKYNLNLVPNNIVFLLREMKK